MKLAMFFQETPLGTVETLRDGNMFYSGPSRDGIQSRVEHFAKKTGLKGDKLLNHVLSNMNGYTWAKKVGVGREEDS